MSALRQIQRRSWWRGLNKHTKAWHGEAGSNFQSWKTGRNVPSHQAPVRTNKLERPSVSRAFHGMGEFREFVRERANRRFRE